MLGGVISLMLFYATYTIAKEAITKLLGEEPSAELINKITSFVSEKHARELYLHHFHIHNYVAHQELTFHLKLDNSLTIEVGHTIATEVENLIFEKFGIVATAHVEPLLNGHEKS